MEAGLTDYCLDPDLGPNLDQGFYHHMTRVLIGYSATGAIPVLALGISKETKKVA